ncbi:glycerol-3-phosphate acyltransferase 2 [Capsulimonas corticalis]|uniref:Glycerol-3-phosphate acyltransferase n=1 Tax=Capsulimonas corticalis TaxID=2219043 RepID=A0A402CTB3_9BACT|nr:glycerol-3-phosphate 1-O-acyltransferase PlsY [Capsulimonas corticalis]BDI30789.1 glycerol-3-phosphate acyltransferase 2 [Capsulimonas corticalis]
MNPIYPLVLLLSYLCGSIPIGLITGKMVKGIDIREYGSGNIGATNVWRTLGPVCGSIVFAADVAKGLIPVVAAHHLPHISPWFIVFTGLAAITGHNASPFLKFKGGKGVATSVGVALGFSPAAALIGFGFWALVLAVTRYISISSILAVPIACVLIWILNGYTLPYAVFGVLVSLYVLVKHKSNIARVKARTEPKVTLPSILMKLFHGGSQSA